MSDHAIETAPDGFPGADALAIPSDSLTTETEASDILTAACDGAMVVAMKKRVHRFYNSKAFQEYVLKHPEAIGLSPGGAAQRLGVSRQRVYQLMDTGDLEHWLVYDLSEGPCGDWPKTAASYVFISEADVLRLLDMPRVPGRHRPPVHKAA